MSKMNKSKKTKKRAVKRSKDKAPLPREVERRESMVRGRHPSLDPRKPSHIPLNTAERVKLHAVAESMGLPYATWARGTLLAVARWPVESQPMKFQRELIEHPETCPEDGLTVKIPVYMTRDGLQGQERSYDGGRTWGRYVEPPISFDGQSTSVTEEK